MHGKAGGPDMRIGCHAAVKIGGLVLRRRNAKFRRALACRDLGMRSGIDIDIDPQRHRCLNAACGSDGADGLDLRRAFGVDLANIGVERRTDFLGRFADTGKNDLRGGNTCDERALHLAAGHDVRPGAPAGQQRHYANRRIRLQREMHRAVHRRQGGGEIVVILANAIARIDVERRAVRRGDLVKTKPANRQPACRIAIESGHDSYPNLFQLPLLAELAGISEGR